MTGIKAMAIIFSHKRNNNTNNDNDNNNTSTAIKSMAELLVQLR